VRVWGCEGVVRATACNRVRVHVRTCVLALAMGGIGQGNPKNDRLIFCCKPSRMLRPSRAADQ
jgi:hypothetical protein